MAVGIDAHPVCAPGIYANVSTTGQVASNPHRAEREVPGVRGAGLVLPQ